jgi:hypothetical protein
MRRNTRKNLNHFCETDYNSNDGMLTTIWGPATWHLLHCISFNYPVQPSPDDKVKYMSFIKSLKNVLPCGKCRTNLTKNFEKLPLGMKHMESRATFSKYIYDLHEVINEMLSKKSNMTYDDVRETYEHFRARCNKSKTKKNKESGCVKPFYGKKTKCILKVVPADKKCQSFSKSSTIK